MSRLVNFGLGEICDRLSILALKIRHAGDKDVSHFKNERAALQVKLVTHEPGRWLEHFVELSTVNAMLWYAEDALRAHRDAGPAAEPRDVVECAFAIQELNDERAVLIAHINALVGDKAPEKV